MNNFDMKGDNMEYIVGKTAGFCFGVKNAVNSAMVNLEKEKSMCCLGEIVHNREVVEELQSMGMNFIEDLNENTTRKATIIRAHGVSKEIYEKAEKSGIRLVDLTCPFVLKIHRMVEEHAKEGYYIFLVGAKSHPETIGTAGFCGNNYSTIESSEDIENAIKDFEESKCNKIFMAVQTTFNLEKYGDYANYVRNYCEENKVENKIENTICLATKERQEETGKISKEVDFMIVIGGKNSSNTKKLYDIAKKNCNDTICVETVNDIDSNLLNGKHKVGIMAGASTPQSSIDKVVELVKNK